jgi:glycosyltransferase involved in cell wall biosynthesis
MANLRRLIPEAEVRIHPHPIYDQFPASKEALSKRGSLELLFYGFVRPYKGLDILIEAMAQTADDVFLTIAGEFWEGEEQIRERIKTLELVDRIDLRPRYHTDQETAELFARCDVAVLPYRSATGSGVVPVAYHYDKPVIVSRVGGLPDVVHDGETGTLVEPGDVDALVDAINNMTRVAAAAMVPAIQKLKYSMTWTSMAATIVEGAKPTDLMSH